MVTETLINIYADGGCRGNPGPGGWGALLQAAGQEKELWGGEPATTNNRMELTAVIRALEAMKRPVQARVHTDSQYVQKGISEWIHGWKRNGWKTSDKKPVKNADLWQQLGAIAARNMSVSAAVPGIPRAGGCPPLAKTRRRSILCAPGILYR